MPKTFANPTVKEKNKNALIKPEMITIGICVKTLNFKTLNFKTKYLKTWVIEIPTGNQIK